MLRHHPLNLPASLLALALLLAACSEREVILPGERLSVIEAGAAVSPAINQSAAAEGAGLPAAADNRVFATPGADAGHGGGHLRVEFPLRRAFARRVGIPAEEGTDMAQPVIGEAAVYTITPGGELVASAVDNGNTLWSADIDPSSDQTQVSVSGGLALDGGVLFAHAGKRRLVSLNAADGTENWSVDMPHFILGGPTVAGGVVVVTDIDGRVYALAQSSGEELWNRIGTQGQTRITGVAYPAITGDAIVIAGGDGELISLSLADGSFIWGDSIAPRRLLTALDTIGDIVAHPIHDGTRVVAVTQTGVMVAYNARTGRVLWERNIRSLTMPWLAGETLFVASTNNELFALRVSDGEVRWKTDLPGKYDMNEPFQEKANRHTGPVVASGRVLVANLRGDMLVVDAETGSILDEFSIGGSVTTGLSVAQGTVVALDRGGRLSAWR